LLRAKLFRLMFLGGPADRTAAPDAAMDLRLRPAAGSQRERIRDGAQTAYAKQRRDDLPGRGVERRETPADDVSPGPIVPSA